MASQPPPGPVPALADEPQAEAHAPVELAPEVPPALPHDEILVIKPNDALDVLVARDAAFAAEHGLDEEHPPLAPATQRKATPSEEWGAAAVLTVVFLILCLAAVSFFRG